MNKYHLISMMSASEKYTVTVKPCPRDQVMAGRAYEFVDKLSCSPLANPPQKYSLAKLLCLLNDFPKCPLNEYVSVDLESRPIELGNWIYRKCWSLSYDGWTTEEPSIDFKFSVKYRDRASLTGETKFLVVWGIPLIPNYSVGIYHSYRNEIPFADKLGSVDEEIEELETELSLENEDLLKWTLTIHDDKNPWAPVELCEDETEEDRLQNRRNIETNIQKYINYSDEIDLSQEEFLIKHFQKHNSKEFDQRFCGHESMKCCCCGARSATARVFINVRFVDDTSAWFCPECWGQSEFPDKDEPLSEVYIRDGSPDRKFGDWKLKAVLDSDFEFEPSE